MSTNKLTDELFSKLCGKISNKIGSDYLQWGRHLGLCGSDLYNIKSDNIKCYDKADNVLKKWKEKKGNLSWEQIKTELIDFERPDIVLEIEIEFNDDLFSQEKLRCETMDFDLSEQARKEMKNAKNILLLAVLVLVIVLFFLNINSICLKNSKSESLHSTANVLLAILVLVIILLFLNINFSISSRNSKSEISSSPHKDYEVSSNKNRVSKSHRFIDCYFESNSSFTDEIKSIVDTQRWSISINDGKTSYKTLCESYFINHFVKSGRKIESLHVDKSILSVEEKKLLIQCSSNVHEVIFYRPINFEGWKPNDKIEKLNISISRYLITKKDFEENFFPWINLCKELDLELHENIDFINEIYEWIRCSNIKKFSINYRGKVFLKLNKLKAITTR